MTTAREIMAADMARVLADTDTVAESFSFEGVTYTGIINRDGVGNLSGYDSYAVERCDVVVAPTGFPDVVSGMTVEFNGDQWQVDSAVPVAHALVVKLSRNVA